MSERTAEENADESRDKTDEEIFDANVSSRPNDSDDFSPRPDDRYVKSAKRGRSLSPSSVSSGGVVRRLSRG